MSKELTDSELLASVSDILQWLRDGGWQKNEDTSYLLLCAAIWLNLDHGGEAKNMIAAAECTIRALLLLRRSVVRDELRLLMKERFGHKKVFQLLKDFGAENLNDLHPKHYVAVTAASKNIRNTK